MKTTGRARILVYAALAGLVIVVAALYLTWGPPKLLAATARPDFCARCHVMEANYEAWIHAGAHRRKACVDCHLPNGNAGLHYLWKTLDGAKDTLVFYSGRVPERIALSSHGRTVLQANCIRCHETTVMKIGTDRPCWTCHRRIVHRRSGAMKTS